MRTNMLFTATTLLLFSTHAHSETFELKLRYLGERANTPGCIAAVNEAARVIAEKTQITIVSKGCFSNEYDSFLLNGSINYTANEAVPFNNAFNATPTTDLWGAYRTKQDCLNSLEGQRTLFTQATGLESLYSYCFLARQSDPIRYAPYIVAVGETSVTRKISGSTIYGRIPQGDLEVLQEVKERMNAQGYLVSEISTEADLLWRRMRVAYYSSRQTFLDAEDFSFDSSALCNAALKPFKIRIMEHVPAVLTVYCDEQGGFGGNKLNIVTISEGSANSGPYRHEILPEIHRDNASCEKAKPEAEAELISQGYEPIALLCAHSDQKLFMHAFLKR